MKGKCKYLFGVILTNHHDHQCKIKFNMLIICITIIAFVVSFSSVYSWSRGKWQKHQKYQLIHFLNLYFISMVQKSFWTTKLILSLRLKVNLWFYFDGFVLPILWTFTAFSTTISCWIIFQKVVIVVSCCQLLYHTTCILFNLFCTNDFLALTWKFMVQWHQNEYNRKRWLPTSGL